ncbi:FitA-like ribbon-helix-helix domain-containing protein [Hyphococcus luteus]|uniref:FitA-like ribbon-helix-helix domain-containing protein n=1 Tax=Hyphococcus luteus TaxID=2058213 RepID=UPI001A9C4A78|nr:plasmid stabilization protein [Marinicaulis flavus]
MKAITIRNVPEETHRRLRIRAAQNGRSLEAELRALLGAIARVNAGPPRPETQRQETPRKAGGDHLHLTGKDLAIDAAQARRKVQRILEREAE